MTTVNSPEEAKRTEITIPESVDEIVATVTGLRKTACGAISPRAWVYILKVVLARVKAILKHTSFFQPIRNGTSINTISIGDFHGSHGEVSQIGRIIQSGVVKYIFGDSIMIEGKLSSPSVVFRTHKFFEICKVNVPEIQKRVIVFMLDSEGKIFVFLCREEEAFLLLVQRVDEVNDVEELIIALEKYPQLGPRIVLAIGAIFREDYQSKLTRLANEQRATEYLRSVCERVEFSDMVRKNEWGIFPDQPTEE